MSGAITSMLQNMDEEQAQSIIDNLDNEFIEKTLNNVIESHIIPHFEEVKGKARDEYEDPQAIRDHYESLSEDEQSEKFHAAAADVLNVVTMIRDNPQEGAVELKKRLRDPWTVEALLLIFDHSDIPDDVVQEQKDFAATWIRWAGVNTVPEMYDGEEIRSVIETLYPEDHQQDVLEQFDMD